MGIYKRKILRRRHAFDLEKNQEKRKKKHANDQEKSKFKIFSFMNSHLCVHAASKVRRRDVMGQRSVRGYIFAPHLRLRQHITMNNNKQTTRQCGD